MALQTIALVMEGNLVEHWGTLGYLREPRVNGYALLKVCTSKYHQYQNCSILVVGQKEQA